MDFEMMVKSPEGERRGLGGKSWGREKKNGGKKTKQKKMLWVARPMSAPERGGFFRSKQLQQQEQSKSPTADVFRQKGSSQTKRRQQRIAREVASVGLGK